MKIKKTKKFYPFYREFELTKPVIGYFQSKGYTIRREVRIGFCRADIVAFKDDKAVALELKLNNLKKAIVQVKNYQLGVDFVYIVFPLLRAKNVLKKSKEKLKSDGIGLITVDEETCEIRIVLKARRSKRNIGSIKIEEIDRIRSKSYSKFNVYR